MKRINKKCLGVVVIIILLLLLIGIVLAYYLLNGRKKPTEHLVYDEFDAIGGKINDSTYFLLGVSNDISFEVIKDNDFSYEVTDSEGKIVENQTTDADTFKIKAPADLYKEGATYHLKLTNGKFKNDKYKVDLINDMTDDTVISAYTQGDFTDLCRGPHVESVKLL